ncbi:MAG: hypothetical protein EBU77_09080 [Betaproteobacteria bacterium]|nr:hypothetical protein [Betaproteobacteria bacterium]
MRSCLADSRETLSQMSNCIHNVHLTDIFIRCDFPFKSYCVHLMDTMNSTHLVCLFLKSLASLDISALAEPVLRRIWSHTHETVALFVAQGENRLCVAELPSPQPLNFKRGVGYTERIVRGATGRAILAYLEATPQEMKTFARGTGVDLKALDRELSATRKRGYASSHHELIPGAVAVAVPFFDQHGKVAGSIGVFGPEIRLTETVCKRIAQTLKSESQQLSALLGYRP